jgi:hypothetical protein
MIGEKFRKKLKRHIFKRKLPVGEILWSRERYGLIILIKCILVKICCENGKWIILIIKSRRVIWICELSKK